MVYHSLVYDFLGLVYNIGCLVYDCLLCEIICPSNGIRAICATGHSFIFGTSICTLNSSFGSVTPLKAVSTDFAHPIQDIEFVFHDLNASDLTGAAMGSAIPKVSPNKSNLQRGAVREVCFMEKVISDHGNYLINFFLVKIISFGDGDLDREVFVVVVHGRLLGGGW
jgi:hypothetical protein